MNWWHIVWLILPKELLIGCNDFRKACTYSHAVVNVLESIVINHLIENSDFILLEERDSSLVKLENHDFQEDLKAFNFLLSLIMLIIRKLSSYILDASWEISYLVDFAIVCHEDGSKCVLALIDSL
jgi:hypothetical protein